MKINVPEMQTILPLIMEVESHFEGETKTISAWVADHRNEMANNQRLAVATSGENDIEILLHFLRNLLVRAMRGEAGERTYRELKAAIKNKTCLRHDVYVSALERANYRWGSETGAKVIDQVVAHFGETLRWDWQRYLRQANEHKDDNFVDDYLLTIKHVGFKVRDLALSCFNPAYAAFDLHVARVPTRIGLLNYGYELLGDPKVEMGSNPADEKNYLFLHRLFLKLSVLTDNAYSPADLDRVFWHLGRTLCGARPACGNCPIKSLCLTGQAARVSETPAKRRILCRPAPVGGDGIKLPYGGPGALLPIEDLIEHLKSVGRDHIIIGSAYCNFDQHTKPQSLDYWLRERYTSHRNTRQAADELVDAIAATGKFEIQQKLECPDTGRYCKGLKLTGRRC